MLKPLEIKCYDSFMYSILILRMGTKNKPTPKSPPWRGLVSVYFVRKQA